MTYLVPDDEALSIIGPFDGQGQAQDFFRKYLRRWTGAHAREMASPEDWIAVTESEQEDQP